MLGFSPESVILLIREQGLDSLERLKVLTDKNVDGICNVGRKPSCKNINGTPNRGQQVSVITQENLKLEVFLFHHQWRCLFDWEVMGVQENTVSLLMGQKRLEDKYKNTDMLPEVNKSDISGMMESIKEYLQSCCEVVRVPLVCIIRKTITVQTYGDYSNYATLNDKIIASMLHLPPDKDKLHNEKSAVSHQEYSRV